MLTATHHAITARMIQCIWNVSSIIEIILLPHNLNPGILLKYGTHSAYRNKKSTVGTHLWPLIVVWSFWSVKIGEVFPDSKVHRANMSPPGSCSCWPQMSITLAPWTLLSGLHLTPLKGVDNCLSMVSGCSIICPLCDDISVPSAYFYINPYHIHGNYIHTKSICGAHQI